MRLKLAPLQGMHVDTKTGARTKIFAPNSSASIADVPMQMVVWHDPAPDPRFTESGPKNFETLAPIGSRVALLGCQVHDVNESEEKSASLVCTNFTFFLYFQFSLYCKVLFCQFIIFLFVGNFEPSRNNRGHIRIKTSSFVVVLV